MKVTDKYVFFWKECLSQWYEEDFYELGVKFISCEQYMMWRKAILFKDYNMAEMIMSLTEQYKIKQAGRMVKNFNAKVWDQYKFDIVLQGNYLRFTQNETSRKYLLSFPQHLEFVEASPYDEIWGIKLDERSPLIHNKETWKGENLLGIALTKVRDILK